MADAAGFTFFALLRSIVLISLASQPIALALLGLADTLRSGRIDGLFAIFAAPMALAFFGVPVLLWSLVLIIPTYYAVSRLAGMRFVPFAVFAEGAAIPLYFGVSAPAPSDALPGYDQAVLLFLAPSLITWAVYAWFGLRRSSART